VNKEEENKKSIDRKDFKLFLPKEGLEMNEVA
jgi:hypothetical protein